MNSNALLSKPFGKTTRLIVILLSLYFFVTKVPFIATNTIPFTFDHGKDSLAIFHLWQTASPKLIGPWTSIPGLFFGPGWYYLLLPSYIIGTGAPTAPVILLALLGVLQIVLAGRYFGTYAAIIITASQTWATLAQSAWNPFPMTLITLVLLIVLQRCEQTKSVTTKQAVGIGGLMSLGFHFSTAFAIFYPFLIVSFFILRKILPRWQVIVFAILGFCIPFVPQLIFEVRHDFIETRAILKYLQVGDAQVVVKPSLVTILQQTFSELQFAIVPTTHYFSAGLKSGLAVVYLSIYFYGLYVLNKSKKQIFMLKDSIVWVGIPVLGFIVLHFNYWYLLGIAPVWMVLAAQGLSAVPKHIRTTLLILYLAMPLLQVLYFFQHDQAVLSKSRQFLPIKLAVITFIRTDAAGAPFSSYHYVPDIYDYSYQYLYFWQAAQGMSLPVEFSYKPGEIAYAVEKPELLTRFANLQQQGSPEKIYFVVEKASNPAFLQSWWDAQSYGEIQSEHQFGEEVTVYVATPAQK